MHYINAVTMGACEMARPKKRKLPTQHDAETTYDMGLRPKREDTDTKFKAKLQEQRSDAGKNGFKAAVYDTAPKGSQVYPWDNKYDLIDKLGIQGFEVREKLIAEDRQVRTAYRHP